MLQYERMGVMPIGGRDFRACGGLNFGQLEEAIKQACSMRGVPCAFKMDTIKSGFLAKDSCLVVYNPENLDYHTVVFVLREVNGLRTIEMYSAATAASLHIGGGITNMDHMQNKLKSKLKTSRQREEEEKAFNGSIFLACDDAMISLGIVQESEFEYRR